MEAPYDVCVLGLGGMGSAALYHAAKRGARVIGLERYGVAHDRGSSHGETRIIRKAYFEAPEYLPLLDRSYDLWDELESRVGEPLRTTTGLVVAGRPGCATLAGLDACYAAHDVAHERLTPKEVRRRFPGLRLKDGFDAVLDPFGGYLFVERCVAAHIAEARKLGASVAVEEPAVRWEADGDGVLVHTGKRVIAARRLVVAAGAWSGPLLAELGLPLEVLRKVLIWLEAPDDPDLGPERLPCYLVEDDAGTFYGFPRASARGLKVAEHSRGPGGAAAHVVDDPATVARELLPDDAPRIERFAAEHLPLLRGPQGEVRRVAHAVCMYTMTPDEHFIVGHHPRLPQVALAAGFSGHGFKMASAVGEALVELALEGGSRLELGYLSPTRPSLRPATART